MIEQGTFASHPKLAPTEGTSLRSAQPAGEDTALARKRRLLLATLRSNAAWPLVALGRERELEHSPRKKEQVKLDFLRFEFKYVLGRRLRERIESDVQHFMTLDPFVAGQKNSSYAVRSLYFDDPTFSSYYQKIDGALRRAKFRLRTYTENALASSPVYLEIKGRYNALVFKHRVRAAAPGDSRSFVNCANTTEAILESVGHSAVADRFRYDLVRLRTRPVMLIDYVRRPYFAKHDADFRLTFDDQLRATMADRLFPAVARQRPVVPDYSVMEIKFASRIPLWFHRIICNYGLERTSISKVCKGIEAWDLVPRLE